jgi:hypothetical protein
MRRFAADENFNADIVRGLLRRLPDLDIVRVQDAGLSGADDPAVLEWAAREGRIVLTHDISTSVGFVLERIASGRPMPGVFAARSSGPIGSTIEDLVLLAECSVHEEWDGRAFPALVNATPARAALGTKMADMPTSDDFARLESEVEKNPTSEVARENLLEALSADPERFDDPRRFELLEWFLEHNPQHSICSTPFMRVSPESAPGAYARLKARWLALVADVPADPQLVRGAAAFVAAESLDEGKRLLKSALAQTPGDPKLWLDLGRMSQDPAERLAAFEKARDAGETLPNLPVWIAKTSFEAGQYDKSELAARELMRLVDEARARFGDKLDWPERGAELWKRARSASADDEAAAELVDAHSQHSYRKHWAQTVLGLLACRNDDVDRAVSHLRASGDVRPDYRLSSYGPSLDLVREVCAGGRWVEGLEYLRLWKGVWDHPRLGEWITAVEERRLPEPEESA